MSNTGAAKAQRNVYLDYSATTPLRPEVLEAMLPYLIDNPGNPSSVHSMGQRAKRALEQARASVASALGAKPEEIFFTSGGTESDNQAILGVSNVQNGRHMVTSAIEHHAVLHVCQHLELQGWDITYLPVDAQGVVDVQCATESARPDTVLVSVMLANNEVGTLQPVAQIARQAHQRGILVHTDAVQAVGKLPVNVNELQVDLLSLAAHKFYGPKGVGVLYVRKDTRLAPLLYGGHQERGLRPGTQNVPGAVGLAAALRLALQEYASESVRLARLRERLEDGILTHIPGTRVNAAQASRLPHISSVSFDGLDGESLLLALDLRGIAVSTGSACTAGSTEPSHVLQAMGAAHSGEGTLRFSLGHSTSEEDADYTLQILCEAVTALRETEAHYAA